MNTPNHRAVADNLYDASIVIKKIIYIAAIHSRPIGDFENFFEDADDETIAALLEIKPKQVEKFLEESGRDMEEICNYLARRAKHEGFLVQAVTPFPKEFHKGGFSFSWGCYTTKWFYTEAIDSVFTLRLLDWRKAFIAKQRKEQKKKSTSKKEVTA